MNYTPLVINSIFSRERERVRERARMLYLRKSDVLKLIAMCIAARAHAVLRFLRDALGFVMDKVVYGARGMKREV